MWSAYYAGYPWSTGNHLEHLFIIDLTSICPQWFAMAQQAVFPISGSDIASCLIRYANPTKFVCQHSLHFLDFSAANRV